MVPANPPKPDLPTTLAIERTRVAYDRTMMAWIRTAFSLITFGFTIYKYFQIQRVGPPSERLIGPREFSLILISLGLFSPGGGGEAESAEPFKTARVRPRNAGFAGGPARWFDRDSWVPGADIGDP